MKNIVKSYLNLGVSRFQMIPAAASLVLRLGASLRQAGRCRGSWPMQWPRRMMTTDPSPSPSHGTRTRTDSSRLLGPGDSPA